MRKVLIATHGKMAEGAVTALNIIIGAKEHVSFINGYVDGTNLKESIDNYFATLEAGQEVIILTDLYGGSVNQTLFSYVPRGGVYLVAGFNLALALEIVLMDPEMEDPSEEIRDLIESCSKQMRFVNDIVAAKSTSQDEDFD